VTETATHWVTPGIAIEEIPQATTIASQEAASHLAKEWGFTPEDACIFLGLLAIWYCAKLSIQIRGQ
jgi:hypothetical protein